MTPDVLTDAHRAALAAAGWREMASRGWRRTGTSAGVVAGVSEYVEPYTARIIAEWWIARETKDARVFGYVPTIECPRIDVHAAHAYTTADLEAVGLERAWCNGIKGQP